MLIPDRPGATRRTEGDLFTAAFQFECVARFQLQFLSQGLGNDDAASLVNNETGIHIGIIIWVDPLLNAISRWRIGLAAADYLPSPGSGRDAPLHTFTRLGGLGLGVLVS